MSYTLVIKHCGKWKAHLTDTSLDYIKQEREWLLNTEYPPICYVIKTDAQLEPVMETVERFVNAMTVN